MRELLINENLKHMISGAVFALIALFVIGLIYKGITKKKFFSKDRIWQNVLLLYLLAILHIAIFSRTIGSVDVVSLKPFASWRPHAYHAYYSLYFIENILIFIPLGILVTKIKKSAIWAIASGIVLSLFIEGIQFIFKCGYVQLDDFMTNVIGTIIGAFIMMAITRFKERKIHE